MQICVNVITLTNQLVAVTIEWKLLYNLVRRLLAMAKYNKARSFVQQLRQDNQQHSFWYSFAFILARRKAKKDDEGSFGRWLQRDN